MTIAEVNLETGEVVRRALTPEEQAQRDADIAAAAERATLEATVTQERTASATDLRAVAADLIRRMDAIKDDPTQTDSTLKVRAIVRDDLAPAIKKIVRYLLAQAG